MKHSATTSKSVSTCTPASEAASSLTGRRPYRRSMQGWYHRDPFFMRYMLREATALAVLAYAVVLMVGVWRLSEGEAAWDGWLQAMRSPWSMVLHAVLLVCMLIHAYTWFAIMPKTMPMLYVGARRVSAAFITRSGYVAAVISSLLLWYVCASGRV